MQSKNITHKCSPSCVCFMYSWCLHQKTMNPVSPRVLLLIAKYMSESSEHHFIKPHRLQYCFQTEAMDIGLDGQCHLNRKVQTYKRAFALKSARRAVPSLLSHADAGHHWCMHWRQPSASKILLPCTAIYNHVQPYAALCGSWTNCALTNYTCTVSSTIAHIHPHTTYRTI